MREQSDERTDHRFTILSDKRIIANTYIHHQKIIDIPQAQIVTHLQKYIVNSSFIFDQLIQR